VTTTSPEVPVGTAAATIPVVEVSIEEVPPSWLVPWTIIVAVTPPIVTLEIVPWTFENPAETVTAIIREPSAAPNAIELNVNIVAFAAWISESVNE